MLLALLGSTEPDLDAPGVVRVLHLAVALTGLGVFPMVTAVVVLLVRKRLATTGAGGDPEPK